MLLFQFAVAEEWLTKDNWANFREWSHHPDADAVIADLERTGSLTPGLNYYRASITPEALTGPPLELPPIQSPTMGIYSTGDFALLEGQMRDSGKYVSNTFRYERIDGPGHWMQWEAPDKVNALLLDFLPR
jgi:pimeloyl-ACP methyl ester carboxylesterase